MEKRLRLHQNSLFKRANKYPLDYALDSIKNESPEILAKRKRQYILKNIVFSEILKVRNIKRKPRFGELVILCKKLNLTDYKEVLR